MRKKILTCFFLLLITSQLIGLAFTPDISLKEKRKLAGIPEFELHKLLESKYYLQLSSFLDDHYPYRPSFVIARNWIDYYIFNTSPSPKVHMGKDDWLYIKTSLEGYLKDECEKRKRARHLARTLSSIEQLFESSGKRFFFIVSPNKATIYPEHVGFKRPRNGCNKSFYDFFIEALEEYPLHGFIRLDETLRQAKKDYQVYYRSGTHWNHRASLLVSKVILERLSAPSTQLSLPDIRFMEREHSRDLAALFSLGLREKSDYAIIVNRDNKVSVKNMPPLKNSRPRLRITTTTGQDKPLLPRAIMYRDSFMTMPLKMIQGSFEEIEALWTRKIPAAQKIDFNLLRESKIVIIEVVERSLEDLRLDKNAIIRATSNGPGI